MATPRETGEVIGSRGTAATADVQTSPSDATPEAVLNNETTHIGGNLNYTGANLNPNVFSGDASEFISSDAYGRTATTANIYFPLLSNSNPVSITVVGSFTVDTVDFVTRGTVTSANMTLQGISSGRVARIDFTGLSGVVNSEALILRAASAGSSITFNF